ncbi:hypothetical protein Tco_1080463 [Tanacetum coccineum]|uniref:Monodehydroascorbate reductase n=1 Tax=Tanacetum coccineum TaxID=301880 RepID=A0ABQ5HUS6_9ASTR
MVLHPSHNLVTGDPGSAQSSSRNVNSAEPTQVNYPPDHLRRWTKDHPLDNIVGNPSRPVPPKRKHLAIRCFVCCSILTVQEPQEHQNAEIKTAGYSSQANEFTNLIDLKYGIYTNRAIYNTMAEQNVPAQPPTRTDEQIVPRSQWLTIGKSNLLFNAQKIQRNPIFQISVDILSNTNFFQAFTASANVPAIYLQQFWKTMSYNEKTGVYSCQVDEQWFDLSADLLRKALAITPVNPTHPFELPPSGDTVIDFVNELGYPEPVEIVSSIRTNYVYQPWRAILSLLNQCLTGKTSGSDKPRHPVLQMLWGIVTQTNVDHAELIWEEFTQGIQTFFSHKASHKASLKNPKKKVTPLLIPYGRFSKVIIYYLASNNNIHRRPDSAVHHTGDDYVLGNLKFVPKGESVEVFGMAIPDPPRLPEAINKSSLLIPKDEARQDDDPDLDLAKKLSLESHQEKEEEEGQAPVGGVTIRDPVSETTSKLHEVVGQEEKAVCVIKLLLSSSNMDPLLNLKMTHPEKENQNLRQH